MATTQTQLKAVTTDEQEREQTTVDVDRLAVARIVREVWAARDCSTSSVVAAIEEAH